MPKPPKRDPVETKRDSSKNMSTVPSYVRYEDRKKKENTLPPNNETSVKKAIEELAEFERMMKKGAVKSGEGKG